MNSVQLLHVIVVIVAITLGYHAIFSFIIFLSSTVSALAAGERDILRSYPLFNGIMSLSYAMSFALILSNSNRVSRWLNSRTGTDENYQFRFDVKSIMYAVLLFLTFGSLLKNIPAVIYQLVELIQEQLIKDEMADANWNPDQYATYQQMIEVVLAFILLINAKSVVNYFNNKIDLQDPYTITGKIRLAQI